MAVIQTHNLVKRYGAVTALAGVSLSVERGEIFGLLGPNGAGKTTLVKVLLGLVAPTSGEASLLDRPVGVPAVRARVGYLPEDHRFPEYHTGVSLLHFYAALLEVPRAGRSERVEKYLDLVGLKPRMHYKVRTYSKGMKQRLGIAQALFHDPEVIFLDEPTDGVDPIGRREVRALMLRLKEQGVTIFLNSHLLGEVEQVCDRVAILRQGELARVGSVAELTRSQGTWVVGLAPGQKIPLDEAAQRGYRVREAGEVWEVELEVGQSVDPLVDLLFARRLNLRHLVEKRQTLEDLFLRAVGPREGRS